MRRKKKSKGEKAGKRREEIATMKSGRLIIGSIELREYFITIEMESVIQCMID